MNALLSIGEAARRAGVSAQTLRHYDKLGLLRPSEVTPAGYRRYSESDCARLELIRTLRAVGFDLDTIANLVKRKTHAGDAVRLQLEALGVQVRALQRQQLILRAAAAGGSGESGLLARLQRAQALARLDRLEREAFLAGQLKRTFGGNGGDPEIWRAATADLPEAMSDEQLEAWLELAEIAVDEGFHAVLRRQLQIFAGRTVSEAALQVWGRALQAAMAGALQALTDKRPPDDAVAGALTEAWVRAYADALGRPADRACARDLLAHLESTRDPRIERYWRAVARLRQQPFSEAYSRAQDWLLSALRARVDQRNGPA